MRKCSIITNVNKNHGKVPVRGGSAVHDLLADMFPVPNCRVPCEYSA